MSPLEKINAQKVHVTLTVGEITELINAGLFARARPESKANAYLVYALQKLDEAVNA